MASADINAHLVRWGRTGFFVLLGYLLAVIIASTATVMSTMIIPGPGGGGFKPASATEMFQVMFVGIIYTGMTAWPGYLLTVVLALNSKIVFAHWMFAMAGVLTALQAMWLFGHMFGTSSGLFEGPLALAILIGGGVGGFCYGLVHPEMHPQNTRVSG